MGLHPSEHLHLAAKLGILTTELAQLLQHGGILPRKFLHLRKQLVQLIFGLRGKNGWGMDGRWWG